jgi:hypothetical protein
MFRARTAGVLAGVALAVVIAGAAVAIAASSYTPKLGSPNGKHVSPNGFNLTAKIGDAKKVYIWINKKHKIKKGQLVECTAAGKGCVVATMKPRAPSVPMVLATSTARSDRSRCAEQRKLVQGSSGFPGGPCGQPRLALRLAPEAGSDHDERLLAVRRRDQISRRARDDPE